MTSRFATAVHTLGLLATASREGWGPMTSAHIASSVGTHAVVIRRVLSELVAAGLVVTRRGAGGGASLALDPQTITLRDIYEAIEDDAQLFSMTPQGPNPECPVGAQMATYMHELFGDIEDTLKRRLQTVTLADVQARIITGMLDCQQRSENANTTSTVEA